MSVRPQSLTQEQQLARILRGSHSGSLLQTWYQRWSQRRALARMDEHLLNDIGLTAEQARIESQKPFWQG